jgi:hypothetical protein
VSLLASIVFGLVSAFLILVVMEGLASLALSFRDRRTVLWATGRKRSVHDPDIGWVNKPNTHIQDMYGPDRYVTINSQGFRNSGEFDRSVPEGRVRVICAGDSFTFGEGVDNEHTWCQVLAALDPRIEPVNMGQTGYGIDQAYLWYKRDGLKFSHQVLLLSFITDDFYRMQTEAFAGYAKPVLDVVNGTLVVKNVPVPKRSFYVTWLARHIRSLDRFRTVEFLSRAVRKLRGSSGEDAELARTIGNEKTREVLRKIMEDLNNLERERFIQPVLVYLPTQHELVRDVRLSEEWVEFLKVESKAHGIHFFDIMSDFRKFPVSEIVEMYIPASEAIGPDHFNDHGNAVVASAIYEKLRSHALIGDVHFSKQAVNG